MQGAPRNVSSLPSQIPRCARNDMNSWSSRERRGEKCGLTPSRSLSENSERGITDVWISMWDPASRSTDAAICERGFEYLDRLLARIPHLEPVPTPMNVVIPSPSLRSGQAPRGICDRVAIP